MTVLVPGGAHEARNWSKDEIKLYLKKRKGFIKLALRFGVDIIPTFSFNEQFVYNQILAEKGKHFHNLVHNRRIIKHMIWYYNSNSNTLSFVLLNFDLFCNSDSTLMKMYNLVEATFGFIPVIFFGRGIFNYT